jgi:hypothetical protein
MENHFGQINARRVEFNAEAASALAIRAQRLEFELAQAEATIERVRRLANRPEMWDGAEHWVSTRKLYAVLNGED